MLDKADGIELAAHVYRNRKILCTLIVEEQNALLWTAIRADTGAVVVRGETQVEVLDRAESYLDGYAAAYDAVMAERENSDDQSSDEEQDPILPELYVSGR